MMEPRYDEANEIKAASIRRRNEAIAREILESWNIGETTVLHRHFDPNGINHSVGSITGADASDDFEARAAEITLGAGTIEDPPYPDAQMEVDTFPRSKEPAVLTEADMVAICWRYTGTHTGQWLDREATGSQFNVHGCELIRFNSSGMVIEHDDQATKPRLEMLAQLGLLDRPMVQMLEGQGLLGSHL
jgi:hypothetical protein